MHRLIYTVALYLATPLFLAHLLMRGFGNPAYWHRWSERFALFVKAAGPQPLIWLHAVSVGEARASQPLVRRLCEQYPEHRMLITTTTPTGSDQVRQMFGKGELAGRIDHCYLPYDYPSAIRRFLRRKQPQLVIVMETEIWPNLFHQCRARQIPLCMVNVRLSTGSYQGYRRFRQLVAATLQQVSLMLVQTRDDQQRLLDLGAAPENIRVTGSIKYDLHLPDDIRQQAQALRQQWGESRPVLLAASTHEGEEMQVLQAYATLRQQHKDLLLVLVPRHPERFVLVTKMANAEKYNVMRRTRQQGKPVPPVVNVLVGDTMGELQTFFGACDVAFVGGSLVDVGGHNILEAAALGIPTVVGPHVSNFRDITRDAVSYGACMQVQDPQQLATVVSELLSNRERYRQMAAASLKLIEDNRGALDKTLQQVTLLMKNG